MRLGLANMPLLLALDIFSPYEFFLLALLKILGQGIIGGMIFSHVFLFSIAGTLSSALIMFGLRRLLGKNLLGFAGLGCAGAMASNCVQLLLSRYLIFGPALRYLTAPFLASGLVTGIGLGLVCEYFCRHSVWYSRHEEEGKGKREEGRRGCTALSGVLDLCGSAGAQEKVPVCQNRREGFSLSSGRGKRDERRSSWDSFNAEGLFVTGLLMALIFLFNRSLEVRAAQFLFFCLLALVSGKKINLLATALFMISIIFFHLLAPFGKVLAVLGPLRITQGGLNAGIDKALVISGLVILSRICVKSDLKLPGTIGSLLAESLRMLDLIRERRGMIKRNHLISSLDNILLEMESINIEDNTPDEKKRINVKSILLLCAMIVITLGMNFIPHS